MFTGIIEDVGTLEDLRPQGQGRRMRIRSKLAPALHPDQSIAVNGVCLTVVDVSEQTFTVDVVEETLRKTTLANWKPGTLLNLERALSLQGRLDCHLVQGHVDTTTAILRIAPETMGTLYTFRTPSSWEPYLIPHGSIALDGISLTIASLETDTFTVAIIPYTYTHTNVRTWQVGTRVNVECDILGKYVVRYLEQRTARGLNPNA